MPTLLKAHAERQHMTRTANKILCACSILRPVVCPAFRADPWAVRAHVQTQILRVALLDLWFEEECRRKNEQVQQQKVQRLDTHLEALWICFTTRHRRQHHTAPLNVTDDSGGSLETLKGR